MAASGAIARRRAIVLSPHDPVGISARAVITFHLQALTREQQGAIAGEFEPIHQMRVATRRLRAAMRVFKGVLPVRSVRPVQRELQWLAKAIGAVRDLDVLADALRRRSARLDPTTVKDLGTVAQTIKERRTVEHARLLEAMRSPRYRALLMRLSAGAPAGARIGDALGSVAPDLVRPLLRSMVRAARELDASSPPDAFHRLRVRVKRARYALEALRAFTDGSLNKMLNRLIELQDLLGEHQDIANAERWLRAYVESADPPVAAVLAIGALNHALDRRSHKTGRRSLRAWARLDHSRLIRRITRDLSREQRAQRQLLLVKTTLA